MKEYIKLFEGLNAANGYEINDTPFTSTIKQVSGETAINLRCNKPDASIIIEDGKPRILTEVTITSVWNPTVSDKNTKVIIQGEVVLNGKVDCYSIEFAQGGHLTINAGARVRIWEGGIVNNDCDTVNYLTIVEDSVNDNWGEFLLHPNVNSSPKCNVKLISVSYRISSSDRYNQPFTIPYVIQSANDIYYNDTSYSTAFFMYDYQIGNWVNIGYKYGTEQQEVVNVTKMKYFETLQLLCRDTKNGTIYNFIGNINNNNITKQLYSSSSFGNGFLGKIKTKYLLKFNFDLYIVNYQTKSYEKINPNNITIHYVNPLQTFIFQNIGSETNITFNYKDLVWDPSFEEDTTPVPTRSLKSSHKSELILPDSPIFSDPIDAFADIDNSNLK